MKRFLLILFIFPYFLFGQDIDSLKLALKNATHDTTRCNILSILAETASEEEWPAFNEQLKILAEKCVGTVTTPLLKKFYFKYLADAYNNTGFLSLQQGDVNKALKFHYKSLKIHEEILDKIGIATSLNNIGGIYNSQGDIPKALDFYHKSLKILEEIMDKKGVAIALNNIGLIYQSQGEIPKALESFSKSLKIMEELKDKKGMAYSLSNIGGIYFSQGDVPKALESLQKSLIIQEDLKDKKGMAYTLNSIGYIYRKQGEFLNALEFYHKSLKIHEEILNKEGISTSLNNIGNLLFKQEKVTEAIVYAKRNMSIAEELGFPDNIKSAASLLKRIYKKQNKYKEAFEMYELEVKMKDSINNEETQKAAVKKQMQYQYETQAKELQNEQDKKDLIAKAELLQREKERNYFVIGFALVIVLALFIFRSYRQKQKANLIITQQKHEVEESRKEILDSIHYAKRIQKAMIPSDKFIEKNLNRLQNKG